MAMEEISNSTWCILRTSGRFTLKLAETLSEDGFEAWTPAEEVTFRVPRKNAKRTVTLPIMPSYVFARSDRLMDLLEMEREAVKPRRGNAGGKPAHAAFKVMRFSGQIPVIPDRHLTSLRSIERKKLLSRMRLQTAEPFAEGVTVRVKDGTAGGSFGGMVARVDRSRAGNTRVHFIGSKIEATIRTSLLELDDLGPSQSLSGMTAQDAAR